MTYKDLITNSSLETIAYLSRKFPQPVFETMIDIMGISHLPLPRIIVSRYYGGAAGSYEFLPPTVILRPRSYPMSCIAHIVKNLDVAVFAHELQHFKQCHEGRLKPVVPYYQASNKLGPGPNTIWEGKLVNGELDISDFDDKEDYYIAYNNFPWEKEANFVADDVVEKMLGLGLISQTNQNTTTIHEYYRKDISHFESRKTKENYFLSYNP